jgi:glucosyl-3-phosphoglycerate phosphatase
VILIRHGQTEFNRIFSLTRRDPGIRDPGLTDEGRRQAAAVAGLLSMVKLRLLIASPYARALETAEIIAADLALPVTVDSLIAERFAFVCDIGSPLVELRARWPALAFDHLPDPWWPGREEADESLVRRSERFRCLMGAQDSSEIAIVTHWGFIRALTGLRVPNGAVLRIDPARPDREAEPLLMPVPRRAAAPDIDAPSRSVLAAGSTGVRRGRG